MADAWESIVFGVEGDHSPAGALGVLDLARCVHAVGLTADFIPFRRESVEQGADVVMRLVLFIRQFRVGPDLYRELR